MTRMTVTQARAKMREAIDKVKAGEEVEITQNGEVVAVWVHPSKLRPGIRTPSTVMADRLHAELERARERPATDSPGMSAERARELVDRIRTERDEAGPE
jgi:antitoxin (DNA-binding transcriptional repressor) of toxin-antitoxin stability system